MSREALEEAPTVSVLPAATPAGGAEDANTVALARVTTLGDVIADKYRLVRTLGRGGMGRIFAADHLLLGTTVALKFLHPHLARDRAEVARFAREARAAATLKSAHAARIIDVDHLPTGELYIVMEYLEGTSLETMVVEGRGLPIADAVMYIGQACDALAEAHSRSIIHRDVKPANLFLTKGKSGEPVIKVLDFGIAKSMAATDDVASLGVSSASTASGLALGTPHYMSPEQITGSSAVDGRSDVWAIGATLYELLTGHLAFGGATPAAVFDQILEGRPTPLRAHRPDVPESLVTIVERCLMRDVTARFQTVRELARAIETSTSLAPAAEPAPFVAGPLSTERFVRSSAPPALPLVAAQTQPSLVAPQTWPIHAVDSSVRGTALSLSPEAAAAIADAQPEAALGPSVGQTVLAALAGPALLVIAAGVVAVVMGSSGSESAPPRTAGVVVYLSAKSGDATRVKAPPAPDKPDRPRR